MAEGKSESSRLSRILIAILASAGGGILGGVGLYLLDWLDDVAGFVARGACRPVTLPLGVHILIVAAAVGAVPAFQWWRRRGIEPDEKEVLGVFARRKTDSMKEPDLHAHLRGWGEIRFRRALDRLQARGFVETVWSVVIGPPPSIVLTEKGRDFVHANELRGDH